jgi:alkanesulfonate monooxygenase SsuD/methylene tetrahydromethanopterin reductase-like flavin-dependent oxidoreductase (luciferase family)
MALDPGRSWPQVRALAQHLDSSGWHAAYVCDHFMPHDPSGRPVDGPMLECWTTLSALAASTSRLRLGSLVLGATYRHPAVVASMAATLDQVSGGRVILGVGAGWQPNEHAAYGIDLPDVGERLDAFEEACGVIRSLLDNPRTSAPGPRYPMVDAPCDPHPVQARLPLLVGGGGERRTLPIASLHADIWHAWADPDSFARKNSLLDVLCVEQGRDPLDLARATGGTVTVSAGGRWNPAAHDADVGGGIEEVAEQLLRFQEAGADEFIVRDDAAGSTVGHTMTLIDVLTELVVPQLTH